MIHWIHLAVRQSQVRMLGNGLCTRPPQLDCRMESACETCSYFRTGTEFLPVLIRQHERANLFKGLIDNIGPTGA